MHQILTSWNTQSSEFPSSSSYQDCNDIDFFKSANVSENMLKKCLNTRASFHNHQNYKPYSSSEGMPFGMKSTVPIISYSQQEMISIFKKCGRFQSPFEKFRKQEQDEEEKEEEDPLLSQNFTTQFDEDDEEDEWSYHHLSQIMTKKPNVVLVEFRDPNHQPSVLPKLQKATFEEAKRESQKPSQRY